MTLWKSEQKYIALQIVSKSKIVDIFFNELAKRFYVQQSRPTRVDCTDGNRLQYGYNTVDQSTFLRYHFGGVTRTTSYTLSADCLSFLIKSGRPIWSDGHEKRLAAKDCQP